MTSDSDDKVPPAPAGEQRSEPLPWHSPKNTLDDPEALARVHAIMQRKTRENQGRNTINANVASPLDQELRVDRS